MSLQYRDLELGDYDKGFCELLAQLTKVGNINLEEFTERFNELTSSLDHTILVIEDTARGKIIGTGTLSVQKKFIHSCGQVGVIDEVVVDKEYRSRDLGREVVERLVCLARESGCYKVVLSCEEKNVPFYEKCQMTRKEILMAKYF